MTPKIRSRLFVRREGTSVSCDQLPKELGGQGLSYMELSVKWKQLVEENADFYVEQDKYNDFMKCLKLYVANKLNIVMKANFSCFNKK